MLQRFNMENANSVSTPKEKCLSTEEIDDDLIDFSYREAVGCLFDYCNSPRHCLCCKLGITVFGTKTETLDNGQANSKLHQCTIDLGIHYKDAERTDELEAFNDADYANDPT